ncbi:adenylate kinase [Paractinoplanes atraurantiacus]|uniref:Adenylate kinase n=1 Tax=Paractinoplanes atraurantiacus TaxID=1036182 RepID=A0A285IQK3_9ACTN|nr:adenylate kinase [Actinoplanes atraurantiacus]SNY50300.1 Adenylate kinase [Actinoplanes atraurantiacus]
MKRILVYGVTGAGKSTLAARIGERLDIPYHSIDDLMWEPGWVEVPDEIQRDRIREVCAADTWVIDAAYQKWAEIVLPRVDLIVGLDMPRHVSYGRLVRRSLTRLVRRTEICNGNRESFRNLFLDRDSLLYFHFRSWGRKRARMRRWQADPDFPETILMRSPREARDWLASL